MTLRFLLDENLSPRLCSALCRLPLDIAVQHVIEHRLAGRPDSEILLFALERGLVVITLDQDFADIRNFPVGSHAGVVRLRPSDTTFDSVLGLLQRFLLAVPVQELTGNLVIVDEQHVRIRRAEPDV